MHLKLHLQPRFVCHFQAENSSMEAAAGSGWLFKWKWVKEDGSYCFLFLFLNLLNCIWFIFLFAINATRSNSILLSKLKNKTGTIVWWHNFGTNLQLSKCKETRIITYKEGFLPTFWMHIIWVLLVVTTDSDSSFMWLFHTLNFIAAITTKACN